MKETEKVPFDSMPPLIRGSFLPKKKEEKLKELFKDVVSVVRCKDCIKHNRQTCKMYWIITPDDWFCADGVRRE